MLSFFRKYEKTFFLFVFAPAVLTLGVSGAMLGFLRGLGANYPELRVFGKEVDYPSVVKSGSVDQSLTTYTWESTAENYGVRVTPVDLREGFIEAVRADRGFINHRISQDLAKKNIKPGSREYQQAYFGAYFKVLQMKYSDELRKEYFEFREIKPRDAERFIDRIRDSRKATRLMKPVTSLSYATPEQMVAAYQEENHLRAFEALRIKASDHAPTVKNVTEEEIEAYWQRNKFSYMIPVRFKVHVLKYPFSRALKKVRKPDAKDLKTFYEENQAYYRNDAGKIDEFEKVKDRIAEDFQTVNVEREVLATLNEAHSKLRKKLQIGTMAVVNSAMPAIDYVVTDQLSLEEINKKHPEFDNEAISFWFNQNRYYRPSSPLLGDEAGYIVWLQNRKSSRMPKLEEVREQVIADICNVSDKEAEKVFKSNPTKYRKAREFEIEVLMMDMDRVLKSTKKPTKVELLAYYSDHKKDFDNKAFDQVKADVEKVWIEKKARKLISDTRDALTSEINKYRKPKSKLSLDSLDVFLLGASTIPNRKLLKLKDITVAQDKITENELLKGAYAQIIQAKNEKMPSAVESIPGKKDGFMVYMVTKRKQPAPPTYKEVAAEVKAEILKGRSQQRAKKFVDELLVELKGLTGDRLANFLKAKGLKTTRSEFFQKDDKELKGYDSPSNYISSTFNATPGGAFEETVDVTAEGYIDIIRCVARKDASLDDFSASHKDVRRSAMNKIRPQLQAKWRENLMADAKSVTAEHLDYATKLHSDNSKIKTIKYRQLVLRPDRKILFGDMEKSAQKEMAKIQASLKKGESFRNLASLFSEDTDSRGNGGVIGYVNRVDLTNAFGNEFSQEVFRLHTTKKLPINQISDVLKSKKGLHLVQILNADGARLRIAHLMIALDPIYRKPEDSVVKAAREATRKKVAELYKRLKTESLASIAEDFADDDYVESEEKASDQEMPYYSAFHRANLNISEEVIDKPIKVGDVYHVTVASRVSGAESADMNLYHAAFSSVEAADSFRDSLFNFRETYTKGGDQAEAPWSEVVSKFNELAARRSSAPTKTNGGVLGAYSFDKSLVKYGKKWFDAVMDLAQKPEGQRISAVIETEYGFHIVEVFEVEEYGVFDIHPHSDYRLSVIDACDWK